MVSATKELLQYSPARNFAFKAILKAHAASGIAQTKALMRGGLRFVMTQELIAQMLGVGSERATGGDLTPQNAGLITYTRGHITVLSKRGWSREPVSYQPWASQSTLDRRPTYWPYRLPAAGAANEKSVRWQTVRGPAL